MTAKLVEHLGARDHLGVHVQLHRRVRPNVVTR